jgi:hypothetical protein
MHLRMIVRRLINEGNIMTRYILSLALLATTATGIAAHAQQEGPTPTQALISFDSKAPTMPTEKDLTIKVDNRPADLLKLTPVPASGAQIAILIDDGLRFSMGRELDSLRSFVQNLPSGTEIFIGYMQNGRIVSAQNADPGFTTDHAAAAAAIRLSQGVPGVSASPYFSLSDFVKNWPGDSEIRQPQPSPQVARKARFVLMITNGVDPYNGSTSIMNQDSPYVQAATTDAQRAGVPVYSIYFGDVGFGRRRGAGFSGQSYLAQVAEGTGGVAYYQGMGNPVSIAPFLKEFQAAVAETYVATFPAPAGKNLARLKFSTTLPKTKVRAPDQVRAGTVVFEQ